MPDSARAFVFGYASLVALPEPLEIEDGEPRPLLGRLHGYRRCWGVAMNNWEGGEETKHWLDRDTGERPRIRVAYLDLRQEPNATVNGVALLVDANRLAALDAREINYRRIEVTDAFEPLGPAADETRGGLVPSAGPGPAAEARSVYTYVGLDAARERCRRGHADGDAFVSRDYAAGVRLAFERLGAEALAEYERTTDPRPFPERDLQVVLPEHLADL